MPNEQMHRDGDKRSPAVGSATDRSSDPRPTTMPTAPSSVPESSSRPEDPVRMDSPPKRVKVSAKSVLIQAGSSKKPMAPKERKTKTVKPVHVFTSSKSKLAGTLGKLQTFAASGERSSSFSGSFKLAPQKQKSVDAMRRLANFKGLFDDEIEEEFLAEVVKEGRENDPEAGSPLAQTDQPPIPEGSSPPLTSDPPVIPPIPAEDATAGLVSPSVQRAGVKRVSAAPDGLVVPDEERVEDQAAGLGSEEATRSAKNADPSEPVEGRLEHPLVEGDGFSHQLEDDNEHGFYFAYNGAIPFLNHKEASAGFKRAVYSAFHGEEAPSDLVLAAEVVELARLEQRVAYKRTHLSYSYENILVEEKSSAKVRLDVVEKEKDAVLAKVKELEVVLASGKKERRSKKLKKKLDKAESDNVDLKKKLQKVESEKGALKKALEVEVESSKIRDLALRSSREAEEVGARELAELKADFDQLSEVGALEVKCLRERLVMVRERFNALRVASETRKAEGLPRREKLH
ncbi:unnamed protein product [Cochlearia groenlandica]